MIKHNKSSLLRLLEYRKRNVENDILKLKNKDQKEGYLLAMKDMLDWLNEAELEND